MDLPHVNAGFVQLEESDFRDATDRVVYQKIGSNLNYLKDQSDTAQADATALFNVAYKWIFQSVVTGSGTVFSGIAAATPNGNPILFALITSNQDNFRTPAPVILTPGSTPIMPYYPSNGTTLPPGPVFPGTPVYYQTIQCQIVGTNNDQVYYSINLGSTPVSSGSVRVGIIYKV